MLARYIRPQGPLARGPVQLPLPGSTLLFRAANFVTGFNPAILPVIAPAISFIGYEQL